MTDPVTPPPLLLEWLAKLAGYVVVIGGAVAALWRWTIVPVLDRWRRARKEREDRRRREDQETRALAQTYMWQLENTREREYQAERLAAIEARLGIVPPVRRDLRGA